MKFSKKHAIIPFFMVGILSLSSCTWDTITRAQAIQILEGVLEYRKEIPYVVPQNKVISVETSIEYFDVDISMFAKFQRYTKIVIVPYATHSNDYILYRKTYEGLGETEYYKYLEEYHYLSKDNNIFYSKIKNHHDKQIPWECSEVRNSTDNSTLALSKYIEMQSILMNEMTSIIYYFDNVQGYVDLLNSLEPQVGETETEETEEEKINTTSIFRSMSFRSVSADVTIHGRKLDGQRIDRSWFSFAYSDELVKDQSVLQYFKYEDFYSTARTAVSYDVNYDAYIYLPDDDIFCEESETTSESEVEESEDSLIESRIEG